MIQNANIANQEKNRGINKAYEKFVFKMLKIKRIVFADVRRKRLEVTDFSSYYINFIYKLDKYFTTELTLLSLWNHDGGI